MNYFEKVKKSEKIFGLVFGPGIVSTVWDDGFYKFEVEFENGFVVPYTIEGIPAWNNNLDSQTIYYKKDIDLMKYDFTPSEKILSIKKIIKLRLSNLLEIRCPSGLWQSLNNCPSYVMEDYLENGKLHLFRKK